MAKQPNPPEPESQPSNDNTDSVGGKQRGSAGRILPMAGWIGGVTAGVLAAAIAAWLVAWGIIPDPATESSPGADTETPFTIAVARIDRIESGVVIPGLDLETFYERGGEVLEQKQGWWKFIRQVNAVSASELEVRVTVQGTTEAQVTLHDLRVRVVQRDEPLAGIWASSGGGGEITYRWMRVDLDTDPPLHTPELWEGGIDTEPPHQRRPIQFPYRVSLSDAETFLIDTHASACDCHWVIDLEWTAGADTGTTTIDDNGKPFRTTGTQNAAWKCIVTYTINRCDPAPATKNNPPRQTG